MNHAGNEARNHPSEDISTVNGTGHRNRSRGINPASYMMMTTTMMMIPCKTTINNDIKEIQKTAFLGTAHVLRKVLT